MGMFDKLERKLERTVNGAFAKAFRAEVQPVEIASAMRRAMDNRASSIGRNQRPIVPNVFTVQLSENDFERLTAYRGELSDELVAAAQEHLDTQRYVAGGPIAIAFAEKRELETGVFNVQAETAKNIDGLEQVIPAEPVQDPVANEAGGSAASTDHAPEVAVGGATPSGAGSSSTEAAGAASVGPAASGAANSDGAGEGRGEVAAGAFPLPGSGHRDGTGWDNSQHHSAEQNPEVLAEAAEVPAPQPAPGAQSRRPVSPREAQKRPWLDIDGDRYPLLGAITIIGRDDEADVILDDPGISRQHTEIRITHDGPHIVMSLRDLDSTNGTFVNGDPVSRARLLEGDRITVGRTTMTIHLGGRR